MKKLILKISPLRLLLVSSVFSLLALAVALAGQYLFSLHPCHLCVLQRIPYAAIVVVGILAVFVARSPKFIYFLAVLCTLFFLADAAIAAYHTAVELGLVSSPDSCSAKSVSAVQTLEEMRAAIKNAPIVSCNQAMVHVMGLSFAAWNMIAAFLAFLFCLITLAIHRNKHES